MSRRCGCRQEQYRSQSKSCVLSNTSAAVVIVHCHNAPLECRSCTAQHSFFFFTVLPLDLRLVAGRWHNPLAPLPGAFASCPHLPRRHNLFLPPTSARSKQHPGPQEARTTPSRIHPTQVTASATSTTTATTTATATAAATATTRQWPKCQS